MVLPKHELEKICAPAVPGKETLDRIRCVIDKELRGKATVMSRNGEPYVSLVLRLNTDLFPNRATQKYFKDEYRGYNVYNTRNGVGGFWISVNLLPDATWK